MSLDLQINGGYDDGSQAGAVRVKPTDSPLVFVPFRNGHYRANVNGLASVTFCEDGYTSNRFGSYSGIYVDMVKPAAGTAVSVVLTFGFYGRRLGLVYARPFTTDAPSFTVQVDGVPIAMSQGRTYPPDGSAMTIYDGQCGDVLADDLADGFHTVDIIPTPLFAGAGSGSDSLWMFYGFLAESRAGYRPEPAGYASIAGTLTATAASFPQQPTYANAATGHNLRAVRKVRYVNTTATTQVVTVKYNGVTVNELALAAAGSAGSSAEFDPGGDLAYGTRPASAVGWQHLAGAASAVNFVLIGRP